MVPVIGTAIGAVVGGIGGGLIGGLSAKDAPQYQQPAPDPQEIALRKRAEDDRLAAVQETSRIDTASLMARYGTRLVLAQSGGASAGVATSPMTAPLTGMASMVSPLLAKLAGS